MCKYCGTKNYRKIYESHFGPIPLDDEGRPYHIHHRDGNRDNNSIDNLQCVSIEDHYDIHRAQGDWAAAAFLASKMSLDFATISELSRKTQLNLSSNGNHHWQNRGGDDETIYSFENVSTGEVVHLTQFEFRRSYGLESIDVSQLVNGRRQIARGWKIHGKKIRKRVYAKGKSHPSYDPTVHNFENINSGMIESLSMLDLSEKYNIGIGGIREMVRGNECYRTYRGWRLSGTKHGTPVFFVFENKITGDRVRMTQLDFWKTYNLNKSHVSQMIRGKKGYDTVKGWRVLR